jgi:ABC-2 type transport system permease protein
VKHVPTVAWRELRSLFVSPVAYAVLSLFAVIAGLFFVPSVAAFNNGVRELEQFQMLDQLQKINLSDHLVAPFYETMSIVFLIAVPAITMGLFAAEKTNGTQELLLTSPLTIWDVVLGKFAAGASFVAILVAMIGAFPGLLFVYGDPEIGKTVSGLLGLLLVGWTYVSIGAFASSLTRSQVVGFLITVALLLGLLILPALSELGVLGGMGGLGGGLAWLSTGAHFQELIKGLVDTRDLAYFAVAIGSFLLLTKASVESVRWR